MKLTVLADNNTLIDRYYLGEPAFSVYIEADGKRILFDTGYSDVFLKNAKALGISLSGLDAIVLSHGHNDHTGGLKLLPERCEVNGTELVYMPGVFSRRRDQGLEVGAPITEETCEAYGMKLNETDMPVRLSTHLVFLGRIPGCTSFEAQHPIGMILRNGRWENDFIKDDTALMYEGAEGVFVITGCSHSGICNIVLQAEKLSGKPVTGILGGFHLMENAPVEETAEFLKEHVNGILYPCHCVSLYAKHRLMNELAVRETGAGMSLEIE